MKKFCTFLVILTSQIYSIVFSLPCWSESCLPPSPDSTQRLPKIVRGKTAEPNEFPFIVSLGWKPTLQAGICGGSIYNQKTIITAAHCVMDEKDPPFSILHFIFNPVSTYHVKDPTGLIVVAGEHYLDRFDGTEQFINVSKVTVHPSYKGNREPYDIALLELSKPLKYNQNVQPIDLAPKGYVPIGFATIAGWGIAGSNGEQSNVLKKGSVPLVPEIVCKLSYSDFRIFSNICAGGTTQDTCNGDSGGPLLCGEPHVLCGVTSYGSGCGRLLRPGAYTKVTYFYDWIVENAAKLTKRVSKPVKKNQTTTTSEIPSTMIATNLTFNHKNVLTSPTKFEEPAKKI